ncbi:hypothetical protein [Neobacillus sp. DY30]|uniref:hypothetical protein n=1 Tax=Neobacillus sp. DY30 TaxID=3047871 RepID=UPI0024C09055|nr:hypothetical protein [Neobacillus sp. DY30]WHX99300.1 hypothetical protein QNH29_22315 [Neobacillus sp. DY30]
MKRLYECVKTILLGICAIILLFSMPVMVFYHALPKDPEIEKWIPYIKEKAEKRAEAIHEWQKKE